MTLDSQLRLPDRIPVRLNLGCGYDKRAGFLNVDLQDFHEPDLVADITALSQLPSGHFELIVAQDVLEHLERERVPTALAEWSRLLAPEGVLELRVPSLFDLFLMLAAPENRSAEGAAKVNHLLYGTQAYSGDYHLTGFTAELLEDLLTKAGLQVCTASLLHGWLFDVRARRTAAPKDDREFVHHAFFQILGRPADPDGLDGFVHALREGRMSRDQVRHTLADCEEAHLLASHPRYLLPSAARGVGAGDGVSSLQARLSEVEMALSAREAEIAALRGSRSWRVTAPLRAAMTVFRRLLGR